MFVSRLPKSPPWTKCLNLRVLQPPVGLESLKGQRKFDACLKLGPAVKISCTRSSTERMSYLPRVSSMTALLERGIRCLLTLP